MNHQNDSTVGDSLPGYLGRASEANALHRVQVGCVGHQAPDAARAADGLADSDVADLDVRVFLEELHRPRAMLLDLAI